MGQKRKISAEISTAVSENTANGEELDESFDPVLAALFASSRGPVKVLKRVAATREVAQPAALANSAHAEGGSSDEGDDEVEGEPTDLKGADAGKNAAAIAKLRLPRKRRKLDENQDLESSYLNRRAREESREQSKKALARENETAATANVDNMTPQEDAGFSRASQEGEDFEIPIHESLASASKSDSADKAIRTVFLGNVSIHAIKSKPARRELLVQLTSAVAKLEKDGPGACKIESLRFRSTAFAADAGPKRAAYAKKELMEDTTTSTNAYVVYPTKEAARKAAAVLNGTLVLDRHLRADYVGQPSRVDHKRCVFVGNLSFVDKETHPKGGDAEAEQKRRPKAKAPADAEEGLWRTFSKVGKVESVRVVRDKETRVGKGFAYVQFADENGVEAALLLNDKKFPPMLPRKLRVVRAKRMKQKTTSLSDKSIAKRLSPKMVGGGPGQKTNRSRLTSFKTHGDREAHGGDGKGKTVVFEGHRATKGSLQNPDGGKNKKRSGKSPMSRSSRRGAAFKAAGGKRGLPGVP